jgi:hypothetical protein
MLGTEGGVLHMSPAQLIDDAADPVMQDWYMLAATEYNSVVTSSPRKMSMPCSSPGIIAGGDNN